MAILLPVRRELTLCLPFSGGVSSIPYIVSQFGDIIGYTRRLSQVLHAVESSEPLVGPPRLSPAVPPASLIIVSSISLTCPSEDAEVPSRSLINDMSFVVARGRGVLITGPTGSGKVTLPSPSHVFLVAFPQCFLHSSEFFAASHRWIMEARVGKRSAARECHVCATETVHDPGD